MSFCVCVFFFSVHEKAFRHESHLLSRWSNDESCVFSITNILWPKCAMIAGVFPFIQITFSYVVLFARMTQHSSCRSMDAGIWISQNVFCFNSKRIGGWLLCKRKTTFIFSQTFFFLDCSKYKQIVTFLIFCHQFSCFKVMSWEREK